MIKTLKCTVLFILLLIIVSSMNSQIIVASGGIISHDNNVCKTDNTRVGNDEEVPRDKKVTDKTKLETRADVLEHLEGTIALSKKAKIVALKQEANLAKQDTIIAMLKVLIAEKEEAQRTCSESPY